MIAVKEVIRWLNTLPAGSGVSIDDGGLTLVCDEDPDAYLEVGGVPLDEDEDQDDDCTACNDRSCAWCREEDRVRAIPNPAS